MKWFMNRVQSVVIHVLQTSPFILPFNCLLSFACSKEGEEWSRSRKVLAPKMLQPKDIRDNLDNFNSVTRDTVEHFVTVRGGDMEIPDLEVELAKWTTESKALLTRY